MATVPGARRRVFYFPGALLQETQSWKANPLLGGTISPARHAPNAFGAFRWTRNPEFFDNRKAGNSTPTIAT